MMGNCINRKIIVHYNGFEVTVETRNYLNGRTLVEEKICKAFNVGSVGRKLCLVNKYRKSPTDHSFVKTGTHYFIIPEHWEDVECMDSTNAHFTFKNQGKECHIRIKIPLYNHDEAVQFIKETSPNFFKDRTFVIKYQGERISTIIYDTNCHTIEFTDTLK